MTLRIMPRQRPTILKKMGRRKFDNLELVNAGVGYYLSVYTQPSSSNEETMQTRYRLE